MNKFLKRITCLFWKHKWYYHTGIVGWGDTRKKAYVRACRRRFCKRLEIHQPEALYQKWVTYDEMGKRLANG